MTRASQTSRFAYLQPSITWITREVNRLNGWIVWLHADSGSTSYAKPILIKLTPLKALQSGRRHAKACTRQLARYLY